MASFRVGGVVRAGQAGAGRALSRCQQDFDGKFRRPMAALETATGKITADLLPTSGFAGSL
jgi:hypothetical protein